MKKVIVLGLMVLMMSSITQAQYKGKYEAGPPDTDSPGL